MFESLKKYKRIIVTGPQRAGTRICARMIAEDTSFKCIDERVFLRNINDEERFRNVLEKNKDFVIHCPTMAYLVHTLADDDTLIVMLRRDIEDIVKSQEKIAFSWKRKKDLRNYKKVNKVRMDTIPKLKYEFWDIYQKKVIKNFLEIEYEELSSHKLWIEKKGRKNFIFCQTTKQYEE